MYNSANKSLFIYREWCTIMCIYQLLIYRTYIQTTQPSLRQRRCWCQFWMCPSTVRTPVLSSTPSVPIASMGSYCLSLLVFLVSFYYIFHNLFWVLQPFYDNIFFFIETKFDMATFGEGKAMSWCTAIPTLTAVFILQVTSKKAKNSVNF